MQKMAWQNKNRGFAAGKTGVEKPTSHAGSAKDFLRPRSRPDDFHATRDVSHSYHG